MRKLISNPILTTKREFEELQKEYGSQAPQEVSSNIDLFDTNSLAELKFFWSIKNATEAAKDNFVQSFGDVKPKQVNVDMIILKKDDEDFSFYYVEFMEARGEYRHGATYASDADAEKIFNNEEEIDTTFLYDYEYQTIEM